jgi:site-specific DNA recombinase
MDRKVAVYARVSTEDQAERDTIENQLHACREHAQAIDADIVAEFRDEGVSGAIPLDERPEGQRLLEAAEAGQFESVLIYRLDRLAREMILGLRAFKQLSNIGTPVVSVCETWDDSPTGRFMYREFMSIAEFERDLIRQRTMSGRQRRVREGRYMASTTPYGYTNVQTTGQLKRYPQQAKVVKQMFKWSLEGLGLETIAERLNEAKIPPPGAGKTHRNRWHISTIRRILGAPRYIGRATYAGQPMQCPRLIDEATFEKVQEGFRKRFKDHARHVRHTFLLRSLVYCRICGGKLRGVSAGKLRYYACQNRRTYKEEEAARHKGVKWHWRADHLERVVKRHVLRMQAEPDYMLRAAELYEDRADELVREERQEKARLQAQLGELDEEAHRVLEWARKKIITEAELVTQRTDIKAQRVQVETKLMTLQQHPLDPRQLIQHAGALREQVTRTAHLRELYPDITQVNAGWIDDAMSVLDSPDADEAWEALIRQFVEKVWVEKNGDITVEGVIDVNPLANPGTDVNGTNMFLSNPPT